MGLKIDSVVHLLPFVKPSYTTLGDEIGVYESFMTKSRKVTDESLSIDEFLGGENVAPKHPEESVLNDDLVGDIDVDHSDDSKPIVRFKRAKSIMKQAEPPCPRWIKTTTSPEARRNNPLPNLLEQLPK